MSSIIRQAQHMPSPPNIQERHHIWHHIHEGEINSADNLHIQGLINNNLSNPSHPFTIIQRDNANNCSLTPPSTKSLPQTRNNLTSYALWEKPEAHIKRVQRSHDMPSTWQHLQGTKMMQMARKPCWLQSRLCQVCLPLQTT